MRRSFAGLLLAGAAISIAIPASAQAAPGTPTYSRSERDCTTNGNRAGTADGKNVWTITSGCDSYQNEFYERPTTQTFEVRSLNAMSGGGQAFGAKTYFENLDIKSMKVGANTTFLFVAIEMVGGNEISENGVATFKGLDYQYNFLLGNNANGAGGFLFTIDQPSSGSNPTAFSPLVAKGYQDTNGDVGGLGLSITKQDVPGEVSGNGFDLMRINDGAIINGTNNGSVVLFARIDPTNPNIVEFALDYGKLGFTQANIANIINGLGFLDVRAIKGGPMDNQNYLWNDQYTRNEAGSPYRCGSTPLACANLSQSEFGTQGLGNLYELDTLRLSVVPEPATWAMMIAGFGLAGAAMRRRARALNLA